MRIKHKPKPTINDEKTSVKYLILPKRINNETRWLEFAKIKYKRKMVMQTYDMGGHEAPEWVAEEFLPYDPVYDCEVFKEKGCAHVDGFLCDIDNCDTK